MLSRENQINLLFFDGFLGGFGWAGVGFLKSDEFVSLDRQKSGERTPVYKDLHYLCR